MAETESSNNDTHAQICFVKKYRDSTEKGPVTKYSFFKIGTNKEISKEVKKWLEESFDKVRREKLVAYNPSVELENFEKVDLSGLDIWDEFENNAFGGINLRIPELDKLKNGLVAVIIFVKTAQEYYGQITRTFPSNILNKKGLYKLHFNGQKFNDLSEDKGLRLHKKADFIFYNKGGKKEGIILDKNNFKEIFDLWEEYRKKALENAKGVNLFSKSQYFNSFYDVIGGDRQIQKMLMNPEFEQYLNDTTYEHLIKLKKEVPEIAFELDEENKDFVLPTGKEKESIKSLIKAISGRYSRTLDNQHLFENSGVRKLLK